MATGSTPVKSIAKKVQDDKYCRVCGEFVTTHSGYFNIFSEKSKECHLAEFLSKVLESEVSISTGSHIICKKCFRTVERCNASLEVLQKLKESHRTNTQKWRSENPDLIRQKRCTKSPSEGTKKGRLDYNLFTESDKTGVVNAKRSLALNPSHKENQSMSIETKATKVEVRYF